MNLPKAILVCLALLFTLPCLLAQEFDWAWVGGTGSSTSDAAFDLVSDSQGNIYVTGHFSQTAQFGPYTLTNAGGSDLFVAKLSPSGNWLWALGAGSSGTDVGSGIVIDSAGNILIAGTFSGSVTFGATILTASALDIFVSKLSPDGIWLWSTKAGGNGNDNGNDVAVDSSGNVYLAAYFWGLSHFGSITLTAAGDNDGAVAKLSPSGNWLWARQISSTGDDTASAITVGISDQVLACGSFSETCSFGPSDITSLGERDAFVTQLDAAGNWIWTRRIGGTGGDNGINITADVAGNAYLSGIFEASFVINGETLSSHGASDILIAKLSAAGNWLWARGAGGYETDGALGIAVNGEGSEIYLTGYFRVAVSFGSTLFNSFGAADIFVAALDADGNWLWARQAGGFYSSDAGYSVEVNDSGVIIIAGYFNVQAQFGDLSLTGQGSADLFIAKLDWLVPAAPAGLELQMVAEDAHLTWTPVTTTPEGYPFQPDLYLVYYNNEHDSSGPFLYLDYTPAAVCHYVHQFVGAFAWDQFYRVAAVKMPGRGARSPEDWDRVSDFLSQRLQPGMTEAEVRAILQSWK